MKDKKLLATIVVTLVVFGLLMLFIFDSENNVKNEIYETKTSQGEVTIDLTPVKFENGWLYLDIEVNTHTTDLDKFDLTQIAFLEFDGKQIKPLSVSRLSGHHTSGEIVFDLGQEITNFKIRVWAYGVC